MSHEVVTKADGAAWRVVGGEMIVVSAATANILSLNGTGAFVWEALDGERSIEDIAVGLAEEYEIGASDALEHVTEFLGSLKEEGLVQVVEESGAR